MDYDLQSALDNLLPINDDQRLADMMRAAVWPFIYNAFQRGLEIGVALARESAAKELNVARGEIAKAFGRRPPRRASRLEATEQGSIVKAIDLILTETPGLRGNEIADRIAKIRPSINKGSVGNDLRNQEGIRYVRDGDKRWFLIGVPVTSDDATGAPTEVIDQTAMASA
jgi:hypothetical protein